MPSSATSGQAWHLTEVCWVEDVFVAGDHRGRGVGQAIMQFAIDRATELGCQRLQLDSNERNAAGTKLYQSMGFSHENSWWAGGRDLYWTRPIDSH